MKLRLSNKQAGLVRQALMDVVLNSPNFAEFEKQELLRAHRRLSRYELIKERIKLKWF